MSGRYKTIMITSGKLRDELNDVKATLEMFLYWYTRWQTNKTEKRMPGTRGAIL